MHHFLFQDGPADGARRSVKLLEHWSVTGASKIRIQVLGDEVEEGSQLGIPGTFG